MKAKKVALHAPPWLVPLSEHQEPMQALSEALELAIHGSAKSQDDVPEDLRPTLQTILDKIRTALKDGESPRFPPLPPSGSKLPPD